MNRVFSTDGQHQAVETGNPDEREANHQHAGDSAATKGNLHGRIDTVVGGLGGTYV